MRKLLSVHILIAASTFLIGAAVGQSPLVANSPMPAISEPATPSGPLRPSSSVFEARWQDVMDHTVSPPLGPLKAKYTVVEFFDFQCPQCGATQSLIEKSVAGNGLVNLYFVHRPFPTIFKNSIAAAEAANAAAAQGKFWEMCDVLYLHQHALDAGQFEGYANSVGIDGALLARDVASHRYLKQVQDSLTFCGNLGVVVTPTIAVRTNATGNVQALAGKPDLLAYLSNPPWAAKDKSPEPQYSMTELGSFGGPMTTPASINDAGQIVGESQTPDGVMHSFLWEGGKMTRLPEIKGDTSSSAQCMNNKGQVVGTSIRDGKTISAVLWNQGSLVNLGVIGDDKLNQGNVCAINDNGQIIVNCSHTQNDSMTAMLNIGAQTHRVLLCTAAGVKEAQQLQGGIIVAIAIDSGGTVVGDIFDKAKGPLGCTWKDGVTTDLGSFLPGGINTGGTIVGTVWSGDPKLPQTPIAALWKNGAVTLLHSPNSTRSNGIAINDKEEVLVAPDILSSQDSLLWTSGHWIDLSDCQLHKGEWSAIHPRALNNLGQIVGYGMHHGKFAAFLMTPLTGATAN